MNNYSYHCTAEISIKDSYFILAEIMGDAPCSCIKYKDFKSAWEGACKWVGGRIDKIKLIKEYMDSNLKCPTCGSIYIKGHFQAHVGRWDENGKPCYLEDGREKWTTKRLRTNCNLTPDKIQILIVPPSDPTWFTCNMCNTDFDEFENIYKK
jgi:hypothetical protein